MEAFDQDAPESPIPVGAGEAPPAEWADLPGDPPSKADGPTSELESPLRLGLRTGWRGARQHRRPLGIGALALALIAVLVLLVLPGATVTLIVVPTRVRSDLQLIGSTAGSRQDGHFLTKVLNVTQSQKLTVTATGSRTVTTPAGTRIVTVVQPSDIDIARQTLIARLDAAIQNDLEKKSRGLRLVKIGAPAYSQPTGAAAGAQVSTFDLTVTESVGVVAFDDRLVRQMLSDHVRRAVPAGNALTAAPIQTWYEILAVQASGTVTLNGHAAAYTRPDLSAAAVRAAVKGRPLAEAQAGLARDRRVSRSTVSQQPLPMPWLPELDARISVRTVEARPATEPANLRIDLTSDGAPVLSGRLTEADDVPITGARIEISYAHLDGGGEFAEYSLEGTVPAPATQALVGLRVNTENASLGPSDVSVYQMAYGQDGESGNRVPNADFREGLQSWATWGTSPGRFVPSDRDDGQMLNVATTAEHWAVVNSAAFGVTAGKRFKFTVAARVAPASAGSGYFTVLWLYGKEFKRQTIPLEPAPRNPVLVATDDSGTFRYFWSSGLPTGHIAIKARWAGDGTRSPVLASITR
ncbi:MAG: hypothetical protein E6J25_00775 [Chloroflexi bacterium]|nr:MAG: hypothetical protein E6J25_00775 [Chloroflexota bacterium]